MLKQSGKTCEVKGIFRPETGVYATTTEELRRVRDSLLEGDSVVTSDRRYKIFFRDKAYEEKTRASDTVAPTALTVTPYFAPTRYYLISQFQCMSPQALKKIKVGPSVFDKLRPNQIKSSTATTKVSVAQTPSSNVSIKRQSDYTPLKNPKEISKQ